MKFIRDLLALGSGVFSALYLLNISFGAADQVSVPNGTHLRPVVVIFEPDKTLVLQVV